MTKVFLKISGMHCVSCAMNIDGELEDTDGVRSSSTNFAKAQTEVVFDEQKLTKKEILSIIERVGYTVSE